MSHWICCNSCFKSPGPDRQLAVTNCGHVVCNVCFQKGKEGECLICQAKCQLSPLSDKSSSEVKALFSDINTIATRYLSEINKVLQFQARHQKRLLTHYRQKNENMKETVTKMQHEMHQMSKKITEQNAYISKLEVTLQHQSSSRLGSQSNREVHASTHFKPASTLSSVAKIPYSSPMSWNQYQSTTSLIENMDVDSRGFTHKPEISGSVSRLCLISPPKDGRIGTVPQRATSQSTIGSHSVRSATVSRQLSSSLKDSMLSASSNTLYRRESAWELPVFKVAPAYKYPSTSTLGPPL
ncbi:probable E3 SUMO-protein ligase RNF212 [Salminus brasiliensis]|uniref:probable E3 SUMO-protein ligase RNF212 n=1 Tax=Salminus brasiliensis TaxID=930266 RepID=UPI003B83179C